MAKKKRSTMKKRVTYDVTIQISAKSYDRLKKLSKKLNSKRFESLTVAVEPKNLVPKELDSEMESLILMIARAIVEMED